MMIKILAEYRPETVVVAWDSKEKTFRHDEFEEYKAQRKPMPDLLVGAVALLRGAERRRSASSTWRCPATRPTTSSPPSPARPTPRVGDVVIVTGDRDALQLVTEHVSVMANTRGITEVKMYDPAAVVENVSGIPPRLVPDLIGLKGDTSDNIPGVPGIGEKTAAQLLAEFGSLEGVLDHVDEVKGPEAPGTAARAPRDGARSRSAWRRSMRDAPIEIHDGQGGADARSTASACAGCSRGSSSPPWWIGSRKCCPRAARMSRSESAASGGRGRGAGLDLRELEAGARLVAARGPRRGGRSTVAGTGRATAGGRAQVAQPATAGPASR